MDLILLYRTVILDIIIMLFLLAYGLYCRKYDESSHKFIPFAVTCLIYSIFGLITEITVNAENLPPKVNDICHIFYFAFGLIFSFNYFKYVMELILDKKVIKYALGAALGLCVISIVIMMFSDIVYEQGAGTKYSQGIGPTLCYALGFLMILISDALIIIKRRQIENSVWYALLPITFVAIILLVVQIVYPLFLFSESAIVLVCMGAFFAIEDPVGKFKKHAQLYYDYAYVDGLTGLFNRRAYSEELDKFKEVIPEDIVCLEMDLNELKYVNDNIGHDAGDELIREAARLIKEAFGRYGKVFRTGGDEFSAIIQTSRENYEKGQNALEEACSNWAGEYSDQMKIAVGAGFKEDAADNNVLDIFSVADQRMYHEKDEYYRSKGIDRRKQAAAHKALCSLYTKILKINLTDDSYIIVDMDVSEQTSEKGFTHTISGWLSGFGKSGQVHADDLDEYLAKTNIAFLSDYFKSGKTSITIYYKRKYDQIFKQVAMEMIPADDYTDDNQTLFLYVKDIDM